MYIENVTGGGPPIYGIAGLFKVNWAINSMKRRRGSQALQLGVAKPQIATVESLFTAMLNGTRADAGEFEYLSSNKLLYMTNLTECSGIIAHPDDSYAIPITHQAGEGAFTNIVGVPFSP